MELGRIDRDDRTARARGDIGQHRCRRRLRGYDRGGRIALAGRSLGSCRTGRLKLRIGVDLAPDPQNENCQCNSAGGNQYQSEGIGFTSVATPAHKGTQPSSETAAETRTGADVPRNTPGASPVIVTMTTVAVLSTET